MTNVIHFRIWRRTSTIRRLFLTFWALFIESALFINFIIRVSYQLGNKFFFLNSAIYILSLIVCLNFSLFHRKQQSSFRQMVRIPESLYSVSLLSRTYFSRRSREPLNFLINMLIFLHGHF